MLTGLAELQADAIQPFAGPHGPQVDVADHGQMKPLPTSCADVTALLARVLLSNQTRVHLIMNKVWHKLVQILWLYQLCGGSKNSLKQRH